MLISTLLCMEVFSRFRRSARRAPLNDESHGHYNGEQNQDEQQKNRNFHKKSIAPFDFNKTGHLTLLHFPDFFNRELEKLTAITGVS